MLSVHYAHRLPSNYDMAAIRSRAATRGRIWDSVPDLFFKAFLLREAGQDGTIANSYSSFYLWQDSQALRNFLVDGRYKVVTETFGRAPIQAQTVLGACRGKSPKAMSLYLDDADIPLDADLTKVFAKEIERNGEFASRPDVVASVVSVDVNAWRIRHAVVTSDEGDTGKVPGIKHEIVYLAAPLLEALSKP